MKASRWDRRFLEMADLVAGWSKDPSSQVGAVIVDKNRRVVSVGFNGAPRNVNDGKTAAREEKLRRTVHAEKNAILFARRDLTDHRLYCTHHPCAQCAAMIIQSGITYIVCREPADKSFSSRWQEEILSAKSMCEEAKVRLVELKN